MVELNGHAKPVKCVAWLPPAAAAAGEDSALHLVSGSIDQSLRVWRVRLERGVRAVGECVSVCRGHTGSVDCVALSPDSRRLCSGSWDRNVKIWSVDELLSGAPSADAAAASESIESEAPPPEKRAREETEKGVTEGAQPAIRAPLVTLAAHSEGVSGIQWTQSNELCTAGMDHAIRFWDLEMARVKASFVWLSRSHTRYYWTHSITHALQYKLTSSVVLRCTGVSAFRSRRELLASERAPDRELRRSPHPSVRPTRRGLRPGCG